MSGSDPRPHLALQLDEERHAGQSFHPEGVAQRGVGPHLEERHRTNGLKRSKVIHVGVRVPRPGLHQ